MIVKKCRVLPLWTSIDGDLFSNAPVESFVNVVKSNILNGSGCTSPSNVVRKIHDYVKSKMLEKPTQKNLPKASVENVDLDDM